MRFIATLVAGAACVATALAQAGVAFTHVPVAAVVGQPTNITWGGGDGVTPVTITLRKGDPQNLQTVSTLTSTGSNGYFIWTPDSALPTGSDYALQITQGQSDINYSGRFAIVGGTGSSSISYSGTSTLVSTSAAMNSSITSMATGASMGTGVPISRNSTFSSQTLTTTTSIVSASRTSSKPATTSATSSGTSATASATNLAMTQSPQWSVVAAIVGVMAAILSLN